MLRKAVTVVTKVMDNPQSWRDSIMNWSKCFVCGRSCMRPQVPLGVAPKQQY